MTAILRCPCGHGEADHEPRGDGTWRCTAPHGDGGTCLDWWQPVPTCTCGNGPLTECDEKAGGTCTCCRDGHLTYHDDRACRRCGCPVDDGSQGTDA